MVPPGGASRFFGSDDAFVSLIVAVNVSSFLLMSTTFVLISHSLLVGVHLARLLHSDQPPHNHPQGEGQ